MSSLESKRGDAAFVLIYPMAYNSFLPHLQAGERKCNLLDSTTMHLGRAITSIQIES